MEVSLHPMGDEAVLVQFEQKIDAEINDKVNRLGEYLEQKLVDEIRYIVPAYCSLTISFDKSMIDFDTLEKEIVLALDSTVNEDYPGRLLYIPVCYDKGFASDLDKVCKQTNLTATEVVRMHCDQQYRIYMIGFLPGFPYLGQLPDELRCERKSIPDLKVPAGAVAIAGRQTGIYPNESPGGWQIIGRTPLPLVITENEHPFLFHQGDKVQFYSISKSKFSSIRNSISTGEFDWQTVYG